MEKSRTCLALQRHTVNEISGMIFGIIVLALIMLYKYKCGQNIIESDSASDIVYAHQLAEEGVLFSKNWYFTSELRILDNELIFALLFKLLPEASWWNIEIVGTAVVNALIGLSAVFVGDSLKLKNKWWLFGLMLLPYGYSEVYYVLLHGAGYYSWAIIEELVLFGVFFRGTYHDNSHKKNYLWLASFSILSIYVGIRGIRLIEAFFVPLWVVSLYMCYINGFKAKEVLEAIKDKRDNENKYIKAFVYTSVGCVLSIIGYLFDQIVLNKIYPHSPTGDLKWHYPTIDGVQEFVNEILSNLGYLPDSEFLSLKGASCGIAIVLLGITLWVILYCVPRRVKSISDIENDNLDERYRTNIISSYILVAGGIHLASYLFFVDYYRARYMLPFMSMIIFLLMLILEDMRQVVLILSSIVMGLMVCVSSYTNINNVHINHQGINNYDLKFVIDYLVESGYEYGMSTFWYANVSNELSDGKLKVCGIVDIDNPVHFEWLSPKDAYIDDYEKEVFIITDLKQLEKMPEYLEDGNVIAAGGEIRVVVR